MKDTDKDIFKEALGKKFEHDTVESSRLSFDQIYEKVVDTPPARKYQNWYRIAAALVVIIGIGAILLQVLQNDKIKNNDTLVDRQTETDSLTQKENQVIDPVLEQQQKSENQIVTKDTIIKRDHKKTIEVEKTIPALAESYSAVTFVKDIILKDGSDLTLQKNSIIDFKVEDNKRMVNLIGNVFFKVKKDKTLPFYVKGENSTIKVTGTSFVMSTEKSTDKITLIEGAVDIYHNASNQILSITPGQSATITAQGIELLNKPPNQFAWKTGQLSYQNLPVAQLIQDMEDNFNVKIEVEDPAILQCKYTGSFKKATTKKVLEIISATLKLKVEEKNNTFVLTGQNTCTN